MAVLIVKNKTREGPGMLATLLRDNHIPYTLVDLDQGEKFPDPLKFKALVVLGGPDSANDKTAKMIEELAQVKKATDAGIPYLGACLGMQVLVKASGGSVIPSKTKEIGWRDPNGMVFKIDLTREGRADPLFEGLEPHLKIFHLHGETVQLTDKITLLAQGTFCAVQAVRVGTNAYGLQGHFELTEEMFRTWISEDPDLVKLPAEELERDYSKVRMDYEATGRAILTNFLKIAGLI